MKKIIYIFALSSIFLSACSPHEDLVMGSIPPKGGGKIDKNTEQIIVYFKDRIDENSLSLEYPNIYVVVEYGSTSDVLDGHSVFKSGENDFPKLLDNNTIEDTLVLSLLDGFTFSESKRYKLYIDNHQLYCRTLTPMPKNCPNRNWGFLLDIYPSTPDEYHTTQTWDSDEPPYIIRTSPPDEAAFPGMGPFPPHGEIRIEFTEPMSQFSVAAASDSLIEGDTAAYYYSILPSDLQILNGNNPTAEFDSANDTKLLMTTVDGWKINSPVSLIIVSRPPDIGDYIDECLDSDTACDSPELANIVLSPSTDQSGAPLIMADSGDTVAIESGSSIFWGEYLQPSLDPGDTGTLPGNIDMQFNFARVSILYPKAGAYYLYEGNTIYGVATHDSSTTLENASTVRIVINGGTPVDVAVLSGDTPEREGTFSYYLASGFTIGNSYSIKASAICGDGKGGFDLIEGIASNDTTAPTINITTPGEGDTVIASSVLVQGSASDTQTGIAWVKVYGHRTPLAGTSSPQEFSSEIDMDEGYQTITVEAADGIGNIAYTEINIYYVRDSDDDGFPDWWENQYTTGTYFDVLIPDLQTDDYDDDNLNNWNEYLHKTDPLNDDTDEDGLIDGCSVALYEQTGYAYQACEDGWVEHNFPLFDYVNPPNGELDCDCLNRIMSDQCIEICEPDPNNPDSDDDGLDDGEEKTWCFNQGAAEEYCSFVTIADTDSDGALDGEEVSASKNPIWAWDQVLTGNICQIMDGTTTSGFKLAVINPGSNSTTASVIGYNGSTSFSRSFLVDYRLDNCSIVTGDKLAYTPD